MLHLFVLFDMLFSLLLDIFTVVIEKVLWSARLLTLQSELVVIREILKISFSLAHVPLEFRILAAAPVLRNLKYLITYLEVAQLFLHTGLPVVEIFDLLVIDVIIRLLDFLIQQMVVFLEFFEYSLIIS